MVLAGVLTTAPGSYLGAPHHVPVADHVLQGLREEEEEEEHLGDGGELGDPGKVTQGCCRSI